MQLRLWPLKQILIAILSFAFGPLCTCWSQPKQKYPPHWWTPVSEAGKPDWEILPQAAKPGEVILSKRNELGILSNFAATPFTLYGKRYASVEGFWQMMLYPEGPDDRRSGFQGLIWPHTREQVAQMTAWDAKNAGTVAEENMRKMGIDWVTFAGKRIRYWSKEKGEHYRLIVEAMRAKLEQNRRVKEVLLSTGDLVLLPDHYQEKDPPAEWLYFKIWMEFRAELGKAGHRAQGVDARALVTTYCAGCHSDRRKSGGLSLEAADVDQVPQNAERWEKVIRKLRAGAMPPKGAPRPERNEVDRFVAYLETGIDNAAASPHPGRVAPRRLNRMEYATSVRDLLGVEIDPSTLLPPDDTSHGFDNMADALKLSPSLLEGYLAASRKISRLAVGDPATPPGTSIYRAPADLGQDGPMEGLPLGTRGGILVRHEFPLEGEYLFQPRLAINTSAKVRGLDFENEFVLTVDGEAVHRAKVGGPADEDAAAINPTESEKEIRVRLAKLIRMTAGPHAIGVTFLKKSAVLPDGVLQPFSRSNFDTQEQRGVPVVESLAIGGPFRPSGPGDTLSRRRIFVCQPSTADDMGCSRRILGTLALRAYRRPLTDADLDPLLSLYQSGRNNAGEQNPFEAGIEQAIRFLLANPEFLFRLETDPPLAQPGTVRQLRGIELASRLSYFVWSSLPDDELIDSAAAGKLAIAGGLEHQVRRMLADGRSRALVSNFAGQWLELRNLTGLTRDLATFPNFDDNLRQGFREETELFVESTLREDRSVLDLLRADYTFLNERLARHYGIKGVTGNYFRRVAITDEARRGLLGQGSVLTITAYSTRTSPVLRGKWLLENIMGLPVPPPPPGIPPLAENTAGTQPRAIRERLEAHRGSAACAVCHGIMDPLGFSLENFDAIGAWRDNGEGRAPIDASGVLTDGTLINGPGELRAALLSRPEVFVQNLAEKLLTYALGRGLEYHDMPAVRGIVREAARREYRWSALILGVVHSVPFQKKMIDSPRKEGSGA